MLWPDGRSRRKPPDLSVYRRPSGRSLAPARSCMSLTTISEIHHLVGQEAHLRGWLYNSRSSGKLHFLLVRDGTGLIQAVVSLKGVGEDQFAEIGGLTQESSIEVWGTVKADPRAPGGHELSVTRVRTVQLA